jgi:anti-anti-sigma factor
MESIDIQLLSDAEGQYKMSGSLTLQFVSAAWLEIKSLCEQLIDQNATQLHIDLSELSRIDLAGIQLLLMWRRLGGEKGIQVCFEKSNESIDKVMESSGLQTLMGVAGP